MTSLPPYRIKVPLLLGGSGARELAPLLIELGFNAKVASDELGVASAAKMCRSIMIKGMEAMVIESFTTARAYGVEDAVLASLQGDLSRHRLGEAGRLLLSARDRARPPPQRRGARGGRDRARDRPRRHGRRRAPPNARPGSPTSPTTGCSARKARKEFARSADWRTEADRILGKVKSEEKK